MVQFKIRPFNGRSIPHSCCNADCVVFWAVFALNKLTDDWIFLKSFYTESRAQNFVREVKEMLSKGDYSCLTLRT